MTTCHQRVVRTPWCWEFIKCALWKSKQPGGVPSTPYGPLNCAPHFNFKCRTHLGALVEKHTLNTQTFPYSLLSDAFKTIIKKHSRFDFYFIFFLLFFCTLKPKCKSCVTVAMPQLYVNYQFPCYCIFREG